jgi:hypothetical protein
MHQLGGSQAPNYCAGVNDISAHYGLTNLHKVHNRNDLFWHIGDKSNMHFMHIAND